ncbi:DUF760 domain-containing protein [Oscillatoria sp. CS-180]|uniref:DUF760 domain-containing protein n=1 Tax=Oscillatoria sp. CS-180 TaxID=3021720 RepID=UPI00232B8494|nr:DUF760 domain-containing protein [Oscillatoria sp. CS-180]MDB9528238.1 DUF760 domain-containing protein [Oscillatoria sp. CS-180]
MNNPSGNTPDFWGDKQGDGNALMDYVQSMSPETVSQLSRPVSKDVMQAMEHNIIGLLGGLPAQHFDISVTTSREHLGRLLASAMMSGYFLKGAEQRLAFEESLVSADSDLDSE